MTDTAIPAPFQVAEDRDSNASTAVAVADPPVVPFRAEDGRENLFSFAGLALPALHAELASAFEELLAFSAIRHPKSATLFFKSLGRFLSFLGELDQPPRSLADLTPQHLQEYFHVRAESTPTAKGARSSVWDICRLLRHVTPYDQLSADLRTHLAHLRRAADVDLAGTGPHSAHAAALPAQADRRNAENPTDRWSASVTAQDRGTPVAARPGTGRTSAMPQGRYEPAVTRASAAQTLIVPFHGEDGRESVYDFERMPFPAFHADFAAAFAARTGPTGGLRTLASAENAYGSVQRFLAFMATLQRPPQSLATLHPRHLQRFRLHRLKTTSDGSATMDTTQIRSLLQSVEPYDKLSATLREDLDRPGHARKGKTPAGLPGYSDREFRDLMAAARSDVVAIRERIRKAEQLLDTFRTAPDTLSPEDQAAGLLLDEMDRTGRVRPPWPTGMTMPRYIVHSIEVARQLFLTEADLAPLVILTVGLTGRNGETVKELPAEHRLLENRAVAVNLIKRRRGKATGRETVHWETGVNDSRQLHTPGGMYLLLHQLTERGRRFSGGNRVWNIWTGATGSKGTGWEAKTEARGHIDPFAVRLDRVLSMTSWASGHGLADDNGEPLKVHLGRVKTAVEVRTTKAMGGHLPSASRTNTMDVSFANYLKGDPVIKEWAEQVMTAALDDAENSARSFRPRVVSPARAQALAAAPEASAAAHHTTPETLGKALDGELDTVAASCLDIDHSPFSSGRCDVSFLTCLRCPNALITARHLPMLLALLDALTQARESMDIDAWVREHGRTWLIITRLILPQFTEAQREEAAKAKPDSLDLDLLHGPKED